MPTLLWWLQEAAGGLRQPGLLLQPSLTAGTWVMSCCRMAVQQRVRVRLLAAQQKLQFARHIAALCQADY
jgi:hypothetical protein